jgi:hypothetical protein
MLSFKTFLKEEAEGKKLQHIAHPEDRPLMHGHAGFEHAHAALMNAHAHMKAGHKSSNLTMKYDGSPAIIFGHHPENKKFFVATKSIGNKNPKINHTHADIEKNHGHSPGLASKLHTALDHLKKVSPKEGVFHGDLMHTKEDHKIHESFIVEAKGDVSFTPNTITYTAKGEHAKAIKKSKIGVVVHQQYHGKNIHSLSASPHVDTSKFKQHPDVHLHGAEHDTSKVTHSAENEAGFHKHMAAAKEIHDTHGHKMYNAVHPKHSGESGHLSTYINKTVKNDTVPNVKDLQAHVKAHHEAKAAKVSTEKAKAAHTGEGSAQVAHIEKNKSHYGNLLAMHHHLAQAKNHLVKSLETHEGHYEHHIEGKKSKPEGFVVNSDHGPDKLVNRHEFAKANLLKTRK